MITSTVKIGTKGEMYLPVNIREEMDLHPGAKVKFIILPNRKLLIEKIPSLEELLDREPLFKVSFEEVEKISEDIQSKMIERF